MAKTCQKLIAVEADPTDVETLYVSRECGGEIVSSVSHGGTAPGTERCLRCGAIYRLSTVGPNIEAPQKG